jgi:dCMP deaminase
MVGDGKLVMRPIDFIREAYRHAAEYSTDPSTQNAAILVRGGEILERAANKFPEGVIETPERWERPEKYSWVGHAERRVIHKAARKGIATEGATMYVPWFACAPCGGAIVDAGIAEVIGHTNPEKWTMEMDSVKGRKDWMKTIEIALKMFDEAGVKYSWLDEPVNAGVRVLFNEQFKNV